MVEAAHCGGEWATRRGRVKSQLGPASAGRSNRSSVRAVLPLHRTAPADLPGPCRFPAAALPCRHGSLSARPHRPPPTARHRPHHARRLPRVCNRHGALPPGTPSTRPSARRSSTTAASHASSPSSMAPSSAALALYAPMQPRTAAWPTLTPWPEVRLVAVDPNLRGRGVARALVDECVRRARTSGATALGLHSSRSMRAAIRLYERMGFVRDPDHDFQPPGAEAGRGRTAAPGRRCSALGVLITMTFSVAPAGRGARASSQLLVVPALPLARRRATGTASSATSSTRATTSESHSQPRSSPAGSPRSIPPRAAARSSGIATRSDRVTRSRRRTSSTRARRRPSFRAPSTTATRCSRSRSRSSAPRTLRLRLSTRDLPAAMMQGEPSLMLAGPVPTDRSWRVANGDSAVTYTSAFGSVVIRRDPWHVAIYDSTGKLLTRTTHSAIRRRTCRTRRSPSSAARATSGAASPRRSRSRRTRSIFGCGESFTRLDKRGQRVVLSCATPRARRANACTSRSRSS